MSVRTRRTQVQVVVSLCALLLSTGLARAEGPVTLEDDVVRVSGAASWGKNRSVWARKRSLLVVMPGKKIRGQTVRAENPRLIREVRLSGYNNRTELELRLTAPALEVLSRVRIEEADEDLVVRIPPLKAAVLPAPPATKPEPKPALPPAPPAESVQAPESGAAGSQAAPMAVGSKHKSPLKSLKSLNMKRQTAGTSSVWILLLIVSIGAGAAWWLRRRRQRSPLGDMHIDVVSSRPLGGKHRLVMVEVAGELLLIGCTDKEIRLLRAVDRRRLQQSEESVFFADGDRMDHDNAAAAEELSPGPASPPAMDMSDTLDTAAFIEQLNRRIVSQKKPPAEPQPRHNGPLDESWAAGILELRRARSANTSPQQMLQ
jgi:LPXTG-motif cell wall-anchored protein